jgi:hypothetical protein
MYQVRTMYIVWMMDWVHVYRLDMVHSLIVLTVVACILMGMAHTVDFLMLLLVFQANKQHKLPSLGSVHNHLVHRQHMSTHQAMTGMYQLGSQHMMWRRSHSRFDQQGKERIEQHQWRLKRDRVDMGHTQIDQVVTGTSQVDMMDMLLCWCR